MVEDTRDVDHQHARVARAEAAQQHTRAVPPVGGTPALLLRLQRTAGNRAVGELLGRYRAQRAGVQPEAADEVSARYSAPPDLAVEATDDQPASAADVIASLPLQRKGPTPEEGFDMLAKGGTKMSKAPKTIQVPKQMDQGMADAWSKSLPGDKSQEQGGILVRNEDGTYEWKAGAAGNAGTFSPDFGNVGPKQSLVGSGHTHPYSKDEGGHTDVSFSGDDISTMIVTGEKAAIVQSGTTQFFVATTAEWDKMVKKLTTDKKKKDAMKKIDDLWDKKFAAAKGTFQQRVEAAVKAVCGKYKLVYYKGTGGALTKQ